MARCAITGTDSGDLIGTELTIVSEDTYGQVFIFDEADAVALINVVNGIEPGQIEFNGTDSGDLMGEPLHDLMLNGKSIGWAQAGWLAVAT